MKAILLGTSGFWKEIENAPGLPPRYCVPWFNPPGFDEEPSDLYPSYGRMEFECIARGEGIAVYLQKGGKP